MTIGPLSIVTTKPSLVWHEWDSLQPMVQRPLLAVRWRGRLVYALWWSRHGPRVS